MVYGFVIHTLGSGPNGSPRLSRVIYSRLFGHDSLDDKPGAAAASMQNVRTRRKKQIEIVARQTESLWLLRRQVLGKTASEYTVHTDDSIALHEEDVGVYGLGPADPFQQEKVVLWVAVSSFGFSLVCDAQDNLTLAESTLRMLVRYLADSLKLLTHSSNFLLRADRIELSLDKFIPHGQLLFLNHQAVQALEKELNASINM